MSHLTIVPEYLKSLLNGRLQKAKSIKEMHQNRITVQTYLDPSIPQSRDWKIPVIQWFRFSARGLELEPICGRCHKDVLG